jgi:sulfane dehydrogenase subunit SoxC
LILAIALTSITYLMSCSGNIAGNNTVSASDQKPLIADFSELQLSDYRLVVDGLVDHPLTLSYDSVLKYPTVTRSLLLVCPGIFKSQNEWTGVPVSLILKEAGIKPEATRVEFSAPDNYYQVLPLESALQDGVFLAYKVDGHVLAKNDGYPLRLVAKDKVGAVWVRVLTHIEVK